MRRFIAHSLTRALAIASLLSLLSLAVPAQTTPTPRRITLLWDAPPGQTNDAYCVYERAGTNWTKVATVKTNACSLEVIPGLHIYSVTASNWWGESEFSERAETPPAAAPPATLRITR